MTMLDFYQAHAISPVRQDVTDLPAHFARRAFLYLALGLWPQSIRGKRVLEVGAGSGENALYTASLLPSEYVVMEPNPTGASLLARTFTLATLPRDYAFMPPEVKQRRIEDIYFFDKFDMVLCEGLLGLCGSDPKALLEHVAKNVKPGGVLVITCIDAISDHAEVLRRALAQRYITASMGLQEKVDALRPVFTPHLATLKGMTRSVEDWIVDNLLNPASIGPTFSIPDACEALEGRFEVLGCSPRGLLPDWRWYKAAGKGNQWAIDAYWANCHNLFDYRCAEAERSASFNKGLEALCAHTRIRVALQEQGLTQPVDTAQLEADPGWFGRGQQYLSFVRCQ